MRRFTLSVLLALFTIAGMAAELNIYASGLRLHGASPVTGENQVHIDYFLNAPATDLKFVVLDATTGDEKTSVTIPAGTSNANYTKGLHEDVVVDLSSFFGAGDTYKWAIRATNSTANTSLTKISDSSAKFILYAPKGVTVNAYPETDAFGTIYVSMPADGQSDGGSTTSKNQKQGIFVWNPKLDLINTGNAGFKGDLTWQTDNAYGAYRLKVAANGDLYMGASHASVHNLYKISADFSHFEPLLGHAPRVSGIEIVGNTIYTLEGIGYNSNTGCLGNMIQYNLDELPASGVGTTYATAKTTKTGNAQTSLDADGNGGFWICQYRETDQSGMPVIAHLSTSKTIDWNSSTAGLGLSVSTRGAMGVSPDKSLLAVCTGAKGAKKLYLYSIAWSGTTPALTKISEASVGNNVDGVAFDYANNLYSVNSSSELLYVWATPKSTNSCTTPAASSRTIVLESYIPEVHVTGVSLEPASKTVKVGASPFTLTATVAPDNATNMSVSWSTTDENVASVDNNGQVTVHGAGSATITVTTTDGSFTDDCLVTVEPYTITYNVNGGTLNKTNQELWEDFMPAYNAYYGLKRGVQPITAVATFANQYMQDFMTNENSSWKWLGDYISDVTTAAGRSIDTEVLWRFGVQAFFNCSEAAASTWNGNADFTTAGQPAAWLPSYTTANLPAHVSATYTLPTLIKANYTFTGWTNGANEKITTVNQLADYTVTAHWVLANPATLAEAVAGKTMRRTLMNSGKLYVLAIDELKNPYIYKINPETSAVEATIPTTGCTTPIDKTLACGITTLPLSDIAFTEDNVLVGIIAENMNFGGTYGALRLYKWSNLSEGPTLWASSTNPNAVGNFTESITGAALTFVGNSTTGTSQAITIAVTTGSTAEYRYVYINLADGEHKSTYFNRSVASGASDIKASTIGVDVQLQSSPLSGDFIITGSLCRPIEVIEAANNVAATYNKTEVIATPTVGSYFFTEDAVKYMVIPTSAGISIYNITSGLATAASVKNIDAANTATYRAVFATRDGNDLILYFQKDDVITKLVDTDFFGVTINSVTLNKDATSLLVGESETLTAEVDPGTAVVTVLWESDDENVATVSDAGVVTAVSAGTAIITATAGDKSDECTVTVTAPIPMAGIYKIGGAEADYTSLHAACEDLNMRSLSADVTFLICDDLTETANSGIVNTTDYTLTIRPDAATKRTITFGDAPDNVGPSGHIVIGYNLTGWASTDTKNVIIDGSYNNEGQYLEFRGGDVGGVVIVYYGYVTNSVVKNCRLINPRTSGTTYVAQFRTEKESDKTPTGVGFENCYMQVTGVPNAQAIYFRGDQSATAAGKATNCYVRGCEIVANLRGIFIQGAINATFENNTFRISAGSGGFLAHGILGDTQTGNIVIRGNKFVEMATTNTSPGAYGIRAITAIGSGTWTIENNYFDGLDASGNVSGKSILLTYLYCKSLCEVRHNTFHLPVLTNKPATALDSNNPIACVRLDGTANYVLENNIFVTDETVANNSLISGTLTTDISGNVFYHPGGNAAVTPEAVAFEDLANDYQTNNQWMPVAFTETYKPTFASANNPMMAVTPISGITTDIEGTTRTTPTTHAGCYESAWGLYLDEVAANSTAINNFNGQTIDVMFNRRFTVADGWYTLVLPFDLTAAQMAEAFGADYRLCELETSYLKSETMMYLRFRDVDDLEAGKPYLFKTGVDITDDIVFNAVTINNATPQVVTDKVTMIGLYDQTVVGASDLNYYLGYEDYLYEYLTDKTTKAFRCYFHFASPSLIQGRNARVIFRDDVTTDLEDETFETAPAVQKIIRNGQLIIIRDGVEYNAQGQVIK